MQVKKIVLSVIASTIIMGCSSVSNEVDVKDDVLVSSHAIDEDFDGVVEDLIGAERLIRSVEVYFETDTSNIPEKYTTLLDNVKKALSHDSNLKLYIQGHADERGESKYNIDLSKKRAAEIIKRMNLNKDTYKRISIDFFGEDKPRCNMVSEEALSCNRRVDIFLVK
jgi:outer membrane protein OmpA-like peptidoglycan-associated protein